MSNYPGLPDAHRQILTCVVVFAMIMVLSIVSGCSTTRTANDDVPVKQESSLPTKAPPQQDKKEETFSCRFFSNC
jgi:uncharacterized protein YceK